MSVTLFVNGYMMVMAREKDIVRPFMLQHLYELMEDAELYRWEPVRTFFAI